MVKVNDTVMYCTNIGIVRRVLQDEIGQMAMVQWIGRNQRNLQPFDVNELQVVNNEVDILFDECGDILLRTIEELLSCINNSEIATYLQGIKSKIEEVN